MIEVRSPLPWVGGKFYSRERILAAFPHHSSYKTFVDVFGGAAHILLAKPPYKHLEVYNDYNQDLVNFWMCCRNHPQELQAQIDSLPYARSLYEDWQASLFDGTAMSEMERATRWFYVLRSAIGGQVRKAGGNWGYATEQLDSSGKYPAKTLLNVSKGFSSLSQRFRGVQIECQDFDKIITRYERPATLFYCDPPYIDAEFYYVGVPPFTMDDHKRLAELLNDTPAQVALSYYSHDALDTLYPSSKWRRVTWQTYKHAEKTRVARQTATELLLMNYPEVAGLWESEAVG
jgi:DNA adenine methylase